MDDFKKFLSEQSDEKPYKLIVFNHSGESVRDVKDTSLNEMNKILEKSAKAAGIKMFNVDFVGFNLSKKNGKQYINSFPFDDEGQVIFPNRKDLNKKISDDYQPPIEINLDDTLIMPRGLGTPGLTNSRYWTDTIKKLELEGYQMIPSTKCWDICTSKYLTDILCKDAGLRTPKTVPISYSEDTDRAVKELNTKFPIILKASTGTQTGVGVVIIESLRSLNAAVEMLSLHSKYLPLIIQEFIEIDYDVRVVVLDGRVLGTMKREVITDGDFRSNISLGAEASDIQLTEIEERDALKAAEIVDGRLVGVDFIPAKNREKEQPYILEVNSMPGFGGIEKLKKGLVKEILEHFKDRNNWRTDNDN
tara:strand:+ start:19 stop:1104 length:1086 start_codon:yes stop_codon:yes gene_type:complete